MKWYCDKSASEGVVLSSRVRLARNLADYPFPQKCDTRTRKVVAEKVKETFEKYGNERYTYLDMASLSSLNRKVLLEDHAISPEFCAADGEGRMLITDEKNELYIMVGEEDHVRIQSLAPGLMLEEAYARAKSADRALGEGLRLAFDEEFGYLTACPTNLGTAMRASCMLHLPALTACGRIKALVALMTKIGLTVRGLYGEGSDADGCVYQISNQVTLGISEEDAIEKLKNAVIGVVERENALRESLRDGGGLDFEDSIWRSYGILKCARKLSYPELLKLWSDVMLGARCGFLHDIAGVNLVRILIETMPAHLRAKFPELQSEAALDAKRAEILREAL